MNMNYVPVEYPKWVGDVMVNSEAEERSLRDASPPVPEPDLPPASVAIRMRRSRRRQREGKRSILCDVSTSQIEALVTAGFIDPAMRHDTAEVARGVGRLMDQVTRSVPVPPQH
jgi:hypothetical protein